MDYTGWRDRTAMMVLTPCDPRLVPFYSSFSGSVPNVFLLPNFLKLAKVTSVQAGVLFIWNIWWRNAVFTVFKCCLKEPSSNPAEEKTLLLCITLSLNLKLKLVSQVKSPFLSGMQYLINTQTFQKDFSSNDRKLTSAEPWYCVGLTPSMRSRRLCRSSFHPLVLFSRRKTVCLTPNKGQ